MTRVCSNLQHFHLDTKTSSWKPHLTLLSKANRPIGSAPAGDYEDVSSDTAAAGSPLAWQALDPRGWNGKIWFLQEGPSVLRGVMRKRCLDCTGRRFGIFGTHPQHRHKIRVPPDLTPISCPAGINNWIFPALPQTSTIYTIFRIFLHKNKNCSAPGLAELRALALNAILTAKGQ